MELIELSPAVLDWAASQAGSHVGEVAQKVSKRAAEKIISGQLTYPQVIKYAKLTGVPLGFLFVDEPPVPRAPPIADFRTVQDSQPLSRDFFEVFDDIEFKHAWLRERLISEDADPLPFVGKYIEKLPAPEDLAVEMRQTIGFNDETRLRLRTPDELFSFLAEACEKIGIFVFKNGIVGNNTSRPLSVVEFRGFAIADPYCPLVFINGADAQAAWVFTLAHELAHIWLGHSGISDAGVAAKNVEERYCNAVAGEFLVPTKRFREVWNEIEGASDDVRMDFARRTFKVSKVVIARRAYDLNLISKEVYFAIYRLARNASKDKKSTGGDFFRTLAVRNSKNFSAQVSDLAIAGSITLSHAGRLLNTTPNNVVKLYEKRNAISI
ncbi:ImmA/IrrE family metallo-endopeptidase [Janthinobacterium sp. CG3]|uniref:ImmA/IrrE family metallo-endopeptidase n=1 Tax=Janthinobacterium sp. CG3 TaxID=1075768 RepID=UPI0009DA983E|nr:ImmA/IrrE family metallo-endopeptidase [Janthinobacterium sp. CG3]